jgi:hypothetical protein
MVSTNMRVVGMLRWNFIDGWDEVGSWCRRHRQGEGLDGWIKTLSIESSGLGLKEFVPIHSAGLVTQDGAPVYPTPLACRADFLPIRAMFMGTFFR